MELWSNQNLWLGLGKQVLSTKYTLVHNYGTHLLFCMCYPKSISFIEFLMDLCMYDDILDAIWITGKKLLHFKLSKSCQILHVLDKTCFPRPNHILCAYKIYGLLWLVAYFTVWMFIKVPYSGKVWWGKSFSNLAKLQVIRQLKPAKPAHHPVNHRHSPNFSSPKLLDAQFAKLFPHQTFLLYGILMKACSWMLY